MLLLVLQLKLSPELKLFTGRLIAGRIGLGFIPGGAGMYFASLGRVEEIDLVLTVPTRLPLIPRRLLKPRFSRRIWFSGI